MNLKKVMQEVEEQYKLLGHHTYFDVGFVNTIRAVKAAVEVMDKIKSILCKAPSERVYDLVDKNINDWLRKYGLDDCKHTFYVSKNPEGIEHVRCFNCGELIEIEKERSRS